MPCGPGDLVLDGAPLLPPQKGGGAPCPIFGPFLLRPNGWMHQDVTWYGDRPQPRRLCVRWRASPLPNTGRSPLPNFRPMSIVAKRLGWIKMKIGTEVGLGPDDNVLDGDQVPPPKGHSSTIFRHVYCGQTVVCIRIPLGTEVGLSLGDIVLDGDPAPSPIKGHSPQFSANVRCGQTTGWTKMPLGLEVSLGPGDCVRWVPATPRKKWHPHLTQFLTHLYCGQTAGWMKTPLGTEVDLGPGHIVLDGVPALRERSTAAVPSFRPILAMVAHLSYC